MPRNGYSLLELLFAVSAIATLSAIAIPPLLAALDEQRAAGAVRYFSTRIQRTRMEAVSQSTNVAMRFMQTGTAYSYRVFVDSDGDGVRTDDITNGVDQPLTAPERLPDTFNGVDFGVLPGLPPVEAGSPPPGADPIKLGAGNLLSYSAIGSSTSGSLYIHGRGGAQYVIRILGDTGRTRILKFNAHRREWKPL
jgi:prepilin-type N-terminal cleavage/methylation domain-containing protein